MVTKCPDCGASMADLFTSTFCSAECDQAPKQVTTSHWRYYTSLHNSRSPAKAFADGPVPCRYLPERFLAKPAVGFTRYLLTGCETDDRLHGLVWVNVVMYEAVE